MCVLIGSVLSEVYRLEMKLLVGLWWVSIVGSVNGVFSFIGMFLSECIVQLVLLCSIVSFSFLRNRFLLLMVVSEWLSILLLCVFIGISIMFRLGCVWCR